MRPPGRATATPPTPRHGHVVYESSQFRAGIRAPAVGKVDGPLIPFGAGPYPTYQGCRGSSDVGPHPLLARVNPAHGRRLAALPCVLVWATTWLEDANECVAPWLGLPDLPAVTWPEPSEDDERDARAGLHWKTRALLDWSAGRPFAWVDDEITDRDREWVAARHGDRAHLHRVDPRHGLTETDFAALSAWLTGR